MSIFFSDMVQLHFFKDKINRILKNYSHH
jgi:hypothetical protein